MNCKMSIVISLGPPADDMCKTVRSLRLSMFFWFFFTKYGSKTAEANAISLLVPEFKVNVQRNVFVFP